MKKTKKMVIGIVAAFLIITFPLLSVGSAKEKEVLIAGIASMTGPVAEHIVCGIMAMEDAFAYINKNGGVDGVKIKFQYHDNRFKVPDSVSIYKKFVPKKPIAFALWAPSKAHEALKGFMKKDKIPGISMAMSDPQFYPPGWIFADSCGYGDQCLAFFDWFRSQWKEKRKIRIGWLCWNSPYGLSGYEEMKKYVAARGGEIVAIEYTTYAPTTVMAQLLRFKEKKVDYIWSQTYLTTTEVALKEMKQAKLDIKLVAHINHSPDTQILTSGAEVAEGYIGCQPWYSEDYDPKESLPQDFLKLMKEAGTRRGGAKVHHIVYSRGWAHAMLYREAIRLALKEVGYKGLNGEAMMKYGFLRIKNYKTPLTKMPFGLSSEDDRKLNPYVRFHQAKGGKSIPISGWVKAPWLKKEVEGK